MVLRKLGEADLRVACDMTCCGLQRPRDKAEQRRLPNAYHVEHLDLDKLYGYKEWLGQGICGTDCGTDLPHRPYNPKCSNVRLSRHVTSPGENMD